MAQKQINIEKIGLVTLQKRKGTRNIRLTVAHDGVLRVSMPPWSPYHIAEAFVRSKTEWIISQQVNRIAHVLLSGQRIGKGHRLRFIHEQRSRIGTRVTNAEIIIRLPMAMDEDDKNAQEAVRLAAVRALKTEAKTLLPQRLNTLASQYDFEYRSVVIKKLKSRWGSCSSQQDIALNCYLMQLPWELIDYVLLHELVHTKIMAHGPVFWGELAKYVGNLPAKRKAIRAHQPILFCQL